MSEVVEYVRTTDAEDSALAQHAVTILARSEGYTVKTVKSVRLVSAPVKTTPALYRVTLAVVRA